MTEDCWTTYEHVDALARRLADLRHRRVELDHYVRLALELYTGAHDDAWTTALIRRLHMLNDIEVAKQVAKGMKNG
jgi:hypothetical protein